MTPSRIALAVSVAGLATLACFAHLAGGSVAGKLLASVFVAAVALASTSTLAAVLVAATPRRMVAAARLPCRRR